MGITIYQQTRTSYGTGYWGKFISFFSTKGLLEVVDVDIGETSSRCLACFSGAYPTKI